MASKPSLVEQSGVTPGKLALIGVLSIVLGGVLYMQFGRSKTSNARSSATQFAEPASSEGATPGVPKGSMPSTGDMAGFASASPASSASLGKWQPPAIASVIAYDPFALPGSFPRPARRELDGSLAKESTTAANASARLAAIEAERQKSESELEGLRQQGVHVIIKRDEQYVAIIGDKEVHVGDEIDGFTVIAIDSDGVRLAKDLSP